MWQWVLSSALRIWLLVGVFIAIAAGLKLYWSRLPGWARWGGVTVQGVLGLGLLGILLVTVISNLCRAPRGGAASMLLGLGGVVVVLAALYLRTVLGQVERLRRANEALKRRVAADHPHDDVSVADDGSVTFKPRR